jgi:hypothetical protein
MSATRRRSRPAPSQPLITVELGADAVAELRKEGPLKALLLGIIGRMFPARLSAAGPQSDPRQFS